MKKKKNKKKKIVKLLTIFVILGLIIYYVLNVKIKNIYINGNNFLSDQEIIELVGIENYPKLFSISISKMKSKIKMNKLIKSVNIKKNIFGSVDIEIEEYNILLKNEVDKSYYLSNGKKIIIDEDITGIPSLINVVDEKILESFLKKLDTIDRDILGKISEIEYKPNEYDKERFVFYMNDGNYVYINTGRLPNINKYENMLQELDGKKGILYLDSGNHFEIIE